MTKKNYTPSAHFHRSHLQPFWSSCCACGWETGLSLAVFVDDRVLDDECLMLGEGNFGW